MATLSTEIAWLQKQHTWPGLIAIGTIQRVREMPNNITYDTAYYRLNAAMTPERCGAITRSRWGIENRLHGRLAVSLNEDQARNRIGHRPENLTGLRHRVLNLLRQDPSNGSWPKTLRRAALGEVYLLQVLTQL